MIVQYPLDRRKQFLMLGGFMISFFTSFWWTLKISQAVQHYTGWDWDSASKVGLYIWIIHLGAGAAFFMHRAGWYRDKVRADYERVRRFRRITANDAAWLIANCDHDAYTVHKTEGVWYKGEKERRPDDFHVEFHSDEDRVLFEIARKR